MIEIENWLNSLRSDGNIVEYKIENFDELTGEALIQIVLLPVLDKITIPALRPTGQVTPGHSGEMGVRVIQGGPNGESFCVDVSE